MVCCHTAARQLTVERGKTAIPSATTESNDEAHHKIDERLYQGDRKTARRGAPGNLSGEWSGCVLVDAFDQT